MHWKRRSRTCHASDCCVSGRDQSEVILLLDVLQLLSEYIAVDADDAGDCVDRRVLESDDDQSVEDAGFDSSHDVCPCRARKEVSPTAAPEGALVEVEKST